MIVEAEDFSLHKRDILHKI